MKDLAPLAALLVTQLTGVVQLASQLTSVRNVSEKERSITVKLMLELNFLVSATRVISKLQETPAFLTTLLEIIMSSQLIDHQETAW